MSAKRLAATLTTELRWISSAVRLIARADQRPALLARHAGLAGRRATVEEAFRRMMELAAEEPDSVPPALLSRVEADFDQWMELADSLEGAAAAGVAPPAEAHEAKRLGGITSRLPNLELPVFGGDLNQWITYRDLFESLVVKRSDLTDAQRMAYLLSTLRDEPRALIQHLPVTDESYADAWELLCARYHNVRRLADAHVSRILALPNVSQANIRTGLLNPVVVSTEALKRLGLPVEQWSFLLLHITLRKLPQSVRDRFEDRHGSGSDTDLPEFSSLLALLEEEARKVDNASPETGPVHTEHLESRPRGGGDARPKGAARRYLAVDVQAPKCVYCKNYGHHVASCEDFAQQRIQARRALAQQRKWCFACLGGHLQRECRNACPCRHCNGQHHPLLCANQNRAQSSSPPPAPGTGGGPRPEWGPRTGGGLSPIDPPPAPGTGGGPRPEWGPRTGGGLSPIDALPVTCLAAERQQAGEECTPGRQPERFSPPLAERPRLRKGPPRFGRNPRYAPPPMGQYGGRSEYHSWDYDWDPIRNRCGLNRPLPMAYADPQEDPRGRWAEDNPRPQRLD